MSGVTTKKSLDLRTWSTDDLKSFAIKLRRCIADGHIEYNYIQALDKVNKELHYRVSMQRGLWMYR